LTLPSAQGAAGATLSNNGSGTISWVSPVTSSSYTVSDVTSVIPGTLDARWEKTLEVKWPLNLAGADFTVGATNVITFNYVTTTAIGGTVNDYRVPLMYYSYSDTQYHIGMTHVRTSGGNIVIAYRTNAIIDVGGVGSWASGTHYTIPEMTFVVKLV